MKQILIADQDVKLVNALAVRCRTIGLAVVKAHDGRTALKSVLENQFDLICLDGKMPAAAGLTVCEALSKDDLYSTIPVIVLTRKKDAETIRRCGEMCAYYVHKSNNLWARVYPVIHELIDVHETRRSSGSTTTLPTSQNKQ